MGSTISKWLPLNQRPLSSRRRTSARLRRAARSSTAWPEEATRSISLSRPSALTRTPTFTSPCQPSRRASAGYTKRAASASRRRRASIAGPASMSGVSPSVAGSADGAVSRGSSTSPDAAATVAAAEPAAVGPSSRATSAAELDVVVGEVGAAASGTGGAVASTAAFTVSTACAAGGSVSAASSTHAGGGTASGVSCGHHANTAACSAMERSRQRVTAAFICLGSGMVPRLYHHAAAGGVKTIGEFVILVEHIFDAAGDAPVALHVPFRSKVHEPVAGIVDVGEIRILAAALREEVRAELIRPDVVCERRGEAALGAACQQVPGGFVLGVLRNGLDAQVERFQCRRVGRFHAADTRPVDVLHHAGLRSEKAVGSAELDEILDVIVEGTERQRLPRAQRMLYAEFDVARGLGLERRIATEAETIGGVGRAKRRAHRRGDAGARGQLITIFGVPAGIAAETFVIGVARRQQQVMITVADVILPEHREHVGAIGIAAAEHRRCGVVLRIPQAGGEQLMRIELHVVLPVELAAMGFAVIARLVLIDLVHHAADAQGAGPGVARCRLERERGGAVGEVLIERAQKEAQIFGVALGLPVAELPVERPGAVAQGGAEAEAVVAARDCGVDAGGEAVGTEAVGVEADAQLVAAVMGADAEGAGAVAAGANREIALRAVRAAAAGDDVDHAADCLVAVQAGALAFDDFDVINHLGRNVLQRGAADGAGIDLDAIDHHQGVIAVGAPDEHRRGLAGAAVAADVDAGVEAQQIGDVDCGAAFDGGAVDDDHRRQRLIGDLRGAGGGDDHRRLVGMQRAAEAGGGKGGNK